MISPKQKAKELIETFTYNCRECDNAKLSAWFAVNEILLAGKDVDEFADSYWEKVKSEIEKL